MVEMNLMKVVNQGNTMEYAYQYSRGYVLRVITCALPSSASSLGAAGSLGFEVALWRPDLRPRGGDGQTPQPPGPPP